MNHRRRTVDPSTLLDPNWSASFPLPPPDGASPIRAPRPRTSLETPPRRISVELTRAAPVSPGAPTSPRGAPDGDAESGTSVEEADESFSDERQRSRIGSLAGGRTETEDDEEETDEDDDMEELESQEDPQVFTPSPGLPRSFDLSLTYEDRFEAYVYDILGNATVDQVHRLFKGYLEENILPNGWLGVWRSGGVFGDAPVGEATASVLVEIENVSIDADDDRLHATATVSLPKRDTTQENYLIGVIVKHPGSPNSSTFNHSWSNPDAPSVEVLLETEVDRVLTERQWTVSLLEIHPVFQKHGGAKLTATALEHVRFFYRNIWRSWDCDVAKDEPYASQCLQSRMTLYYDMEEGKVNPEDQEKYEKTIEQYQDVRTQLKALHDSMDVSDSENELDEADVAQCAALYEREMALETAIQALENPLLRFLQHDTNFSKMKRQLALRLRGDSTEAVTHIVAKQFRARMTQGLEAEALVEHHPTLTSAMENYCHGDIIHMHEGVYSGVSLHSTANGTIINGQMQNSTSPTLRKRPVQVSESASEVLENGEKEAVDAEDLKTGEDPENNNCKSANVVEIQISAQSSAFIDVDPDAGPVTVTNVNVRHLCLQDMNKSTLNDSAIKQSGSDVESHKNELICVKRGTLVLQNVCLHPGAIAISVREGATLKMHDCLIKGAEMVGILAHTNSTLDLKNNTFVECSKDVEYSSILGEVSSVEACQALER